MIRHEESAERQQAAYIEAVRVAPVSNGWIVEVAYDRNLIPSKLAVFAHLNDAVDYARHVLEKASEGKRDEQA